MDRIFKFKIRVSDQSLTISLDTSCIKAVKFLCLQWAFRGRSTPNKSSVFQRYLYAKKPVKTQHL